MAKLTREIARGPDRKGVSPISDQIARRLFTGIKQQ